MGGNKHENACHLSMTETHGPPAFYIFCKTTPIQKDFLLGLCLPAIQLQLLHLLSFLKDFVLIKSVSLEDCIPL